MDDATQSPELSPVITKKGKGASSQQKAAKPKLVSIKGSKVKLLSPELEQAPNENPQLAMPLSKKPELSSRAVKLSPKAVKLSPKAVKLSRVAKTQNPPMLNMVLDALSNNKSTKGLTLQTIKRYITEKYPDIKESFSNARLRKALLKGLEGNEIIRTKSSEEMGLRGYFLLNRTLSSQKEKMKQQALNAKEKTSAANDDKQIKKRLPKVAIKRASISKAASSRKTTAPKSKTPERKNRKEPKVILKKNEATKVKKSTKKLSSQKVTAAIKVTATPTTMAATPKLSKSTKAGARKKTAAVRKLLKAAE